MQMLLIEIFGCIFNAVLNLFCISKMEIKASILLLLLLKFSIIS